MHLENGFPVRIIDFSKRFRHSDPGIIDNAVNATEACQCGVYEPVFRSAVSRMSPTTTIALRTGFPHDVLS